MSNTTSPPPMVLSLGLTAVGAVPLVPLALKQEDPALSGSTLRKFALYDFFHGLLRGHVDNLLHGALNDFLHGLRHGDVDNQSDLSRTRRGLDTRPCVGQISVWPAIR